MSAHTVDPRLGIAARAGLPWGEELVDDAALSARLGRGVTATYVRVKEGRSLVVAWLASDGSGERGWAGVFRDRAKRDNAIRRAERALSPLTEHESGEAFLLSGPVDSDPELARELAGTRAELGVRPRTVLRYNPRRRVVARLDGPEGPGVLRTATTPGWGVVAATREWARLGAPVLPTSQVLSQSTLTPWWGHSDLLRDPDEAAAERAGRDVARVHAGGARGVDTFAADATPQASAISAVAPWLGERVDALTSELSRRAATGPVGPLHGDLSPDQILVGDARDIRIIDLDRATTGPAVRDIGSWLAACRIHGLPGLGEAFLAGYGVIPGGDVAAWEAFGLLSRALEPYRALDPRWPAALEARVRLAEEVMER